MSLHTCKTSLTMETSSSSRLSANRSSIVLPCVHAANFLDGKFVWPNNCHRDILPRPIQPSPNSMQRHGIVYCDCDGWLNINASNRRKDLNTAMYVVTEINAPDLLHSAEFHADPHLNPCFVYPWSDDLHPLHSKLNAAKQLRCGYWTRNFSNAR